MLVGYTPFYKSGMDQSELFKAIVKGYFRLPMKLSPGAVEIISGFLTKDPSMRLGSLAGGEADVLRSTFLRSVDINRLRKRTIRPPQIPTIKNPLDSSNFEDWNHLDDKMSQNYPPLSPDRESVFHNF
jgi:serine/threonine protein kinase